LAWGLAREKMMVIVVVNMLLGGGLRMRSSGIAKDRLAGNSAPNAEASVGRERSSTSGAGVGGLAGLAGSRQILGGRAARHARDGFDGCGYGLGIRFWPAEIAGEWRRFFHAACDWVLNGLVVFRFRLWI
jgi:hypothetical protein